MRTQRLKSVDTRTRPQAAQTATYLHESRVVLVGIELVQLAHVLAAQAVDEGHRHAHRLPAAVWVRSVAARAALHGRRVGVARGRELERHCVCWERDKGAAGADQVPPALPHVGSVNVAAVARIGQPILRRLQHRKRAHDQDDRQRDQAQDAERDPEGTVGRPPPIDNGAASTTSTTVSNVV